MAKKKTRKKTRPPGYDPNEARRQRLEARRKAREEEAKKQMRARQREVWVRRVIVLLLLSGLFWFIFLRSTRPETIDDRPVSLFSETIATPNHVDGTVNYEMTPPVVGQHSANSISCGTYAQTPPNEQFVHSLEHGTIGILYKPNAIPQADIERIEELVRTFDSHVLSAPYPDMEPAIAVTSWGEMMQLDSLDLQAIREYIDAFINKGPEKIDCPMNANDSFEPEPTPSPSPEGDGGG